MAQKPGKKIQIYEIDSGDSIFKKIRGTKTDKCRVNCLVNRWIDWILPEKYFLFPSNSAKKPETFKDRRNDFRKMLLKCQLNHIYHDKATTESDIW